MKLLTHQQREAIDSLSRNSRAWAQFVEWLETSLHAAMDACASADDERLVRRLQGEVRTLRDQLKVLKPQG